MSNTDNTKPRKCSEEGCPHIVVTGGYCRKHGKMRLASGLPLLPPMAPSGARLHGDPVRWTSDDARYLEENYGLIKPETIAKNLGRTLEAVRCKVKRMGLRLGGTYGWALCEIASVLDVRRATIRLQWIPNGLEARRIARAGFTKRDVGASWVITTKSLREFLIRRPEMYDWTSLNSTLRHMINLQNMPPRPKAKVCVCSCGKRWQVPLSMTPRCYQCGRLMSPMAVGYATCFSKPDKQKTILLRNQSYYLEKEDRVQCLICGRKLRAITGKHLQGHKLSGMEYRAKFGLSPRAPLFIRSARPDGALAAKNWGKNAGK